MTSFSYLIAVTSFFGGAFFGGALVYLLLKGRLTTREPPMPARSARLSSPWFGRVVGLSVIVCSLVSVGISVSAQRDSLAAARGLAQVTACQQDYNERFAQALNARQVITDEDRAALDELVIRVTSASSREESRDALQDYIDRRRRADLARARNPLPDPLNGRCEEKGRSS